MKFDLLLFYRDNPDTLYCWLKRLLRQTDFLEHPPQDRRVIICDSGTPEDRQAETLCVLRSFKAVTDLTYLWVDTSAERSKVPDGIDARCAAITHNVALKYVCQHDLVFHSILSMIYTPDYFRDCLELHAANERLLLQPFQYRLESDTYYADDFHKSFRDAVHGRKIRAWNGMPDWSVRRQHLLDIGGWDEDYRAWGMVDVDLCARLTGKTDMGVAAENILTDWTGREQGLAAPSYTNHGLELCRTEHQPWLFSLICNEYRGHVKPDDAKEAAAVMTMMTFLKKWGIVKRESPTQVPWKITEIG